MLVVFPALAALNTVFVFQNLNPCPWGCIGLLFLSKQLAIHIIKLYFVRLSNFEVLF